MSQMSYPNGPYHVRRPNQPQQLDGAPGTTAAVYVKALSETGGVGYILSN